MRPVLSCITSPETRPTPPNETQPCTYPYDYRHHRTYAQRSTDLDSEVGRAFGLLVFLPYAIYRHPSMHDQEHAEQRRNNITKFKPRERASAFTHSFHCLTHAIKSEQSSRSSAFCLSPSPALHIPDFIFTLCHILHIRFPAFTACIGVHMRIVPCLCLFAITHPSFFLLLRAWSLIAHDIFFTGFFGSVRL